MSHDKPIPLPRFALPLFYERVRCRFCQHPIRETNLTFVGAGRDKDGNPCFAYEYLCPSCRSQFGQVVDTTHPFTRPDWWNEIAAWHDAAPETGQMAADSGLARRNFPKIGPMVLGTWPLESVWIRGGYKGEVGPVIFHYESEGEDATIGFIRLERGGHFTFLDFEDKYCLPRLDFGRFAAVRDGGTFPLDGQNWIKMSRSEIEEIIRDRVFDLLPDDDLADADLVATPPLKNRRGRGSTHAPKGRKGTRRPPRDPRPRVEAVGDDTAGDAMINKEERPEFFARNVSVLYCSPGNFDHAHGEPASIITLARVKDGAINPWVISMHDSKLLAVKLLVVLATYDDKFAQHVLDQFPADEEGDFRWPDQPYQLF